MESDTKKMEKLESEIGALFSGDDDTLLSQLTSLNISMISQSMAKDNWISALERKQHEHTLQIDGAKFTVKTAWKIVEKQRSEIKALKAQLGSQACVSQRPIGNSMMEDSDSFVMESNGNSEMVQLDLQARIVQSSIGNSIFENSDDNELFEKLFSQLDEKNEAIEALQKEVDYLRENKAQNDHATEASFANDSDATDSDYPDYADDHSDYADDHSDYSDVTADDYSDYADATDSDHAMEASFANNTDAIDSGYFNDANDFTDNDYFDDANDYSNDFDKSNPCGFDPTAFPDIGPFASLFCGDNNKSSTPKQQHHVQDADQDSKAFIVQCLKQIKLLVADDLSTEARDKAIYYLTQAIVDQYSKHAIFKNENIGLRDRILALECELNKLRRHKVYRVWTEDGKGLYSGQSTNEYDRFYMSHLEGQGVFGKKLKKWFEDGKRVYYATVKEGLTELEANDLENSLIMFDKKDKSNKVCCNEARGRMTRRFQKMSPAEHEAEIQKAHDLAAAVFRTLTPEMLISKENAKKFQKPVVRNCVVCSNRFTNTRSFIKCYDCKHAVKMGNCARVGCPKKNVGIDEDNLCYSCFRNKRKADKKGAEQKPFEPSRARTNSNFDNQTQKALTYSIFKLAGAIGKRAAARMIGSFSNKPIPDITVKSWFKKFTAKDEEDKSTFNDDALKRFLTVKKQSTLSKATVRALIIYEFDCDKSVEDATSRINSLFNVSLKEHVTLEQVQAMYDKLRAKSLELKAMYDESKKASLKRKGKNSSSNSGDKRPKLN